MQKESVGGKSMKGMETSLQHAPLHTATYRGTTGKVEAKAETPT